jgi:hypothetical protein
MEQELSASNIGPIVRYLSGHGTSPSEAEQNFMMRNIAAGRPASEVFALPLGSQSGIANMFLNSQNRSRNNESMRGIEELAPLGPPVLQP